MSLAGVSRENLRIAIQSHDDNITAIAKQSGYSRTHIRRVEAGVHNPTLLFVECMAETLGIPVAEMLGFKETP